MVFIFSMQGWLSLSILFLGSHTSLCQEGNTKPSCLLHRTMTAWRYNMECSNVDSFSFITPLLPTEPADVGWFTLKESTVQITRTDFEHKAFQNTKVIEIVRCNLSTINPEHFASLGNLTLLSIMNNNLTNISSNSFLGLENLTALYLRDNQITSADIFTNLHNLKYLDIAQNQITVLNDETFKGLVRLRSLDFTHNMIESISPGAFTELTQLSSLKLGYNRLQSLSPALFQTNTRLKHLDLSGNNLANLANYPLNIPSLEQLNLNDCKIQSIPIDYFVNLKNVIYLMLSNNELRLIEDVHLEALPTLHNLYLDSNKLTSINLTAFRELYPVFTANAWETGGMDVKNNPWNCSEPVGEEMVEPCRGIGIVTSIYELQTIGWYDGDDL